MKWNSTSTKSKSAINEKNFFNVFLMKIKQKKLKSKFKVLDTLTYFTWALKKLLDQWSWTW